MKRRTLAILIAIVLVSVVLVPMSSAQVIADIPEPPAIRITPPAPVFDDAKRLDELAARRKKVADSIGPKSLLILFGAEPRVYANDVDFPFRQENNFFYLTNLNQQREILVLLPGIVSPLLQTPPRYRYPNAMFAQEPMRKAHGSSRPVQVCELLSPGKM